MTERSNAVPQLNRVFNSPPESEPTKVCYETKIHFTHMELKAALENSIGKLCDGNFKIMRMEFFLQAILFKTKSMPDRWVITLDSPESAILGAKRGFYLGGQQCVLRLYDEVMAEEYRQFKGVMRIVNLINGTNKSKDIQTDGKVTNRMRTGCEKSEESDDDPLNSTCHF